MAENAGSAFANRMRMQSEASFERWMRTPTTKLMISLIPPATPPEVLQTLIREAFEFGVHVGETIVAGEIVAKMMQDRKP